MKATFIALLALISITTAASAQTIPRGARVRVTPASPSPLVVGQLIAIDDSAVTIRRQRGRGDITIPRSAVLRLEVSQGTSRGVSALRGALLGSVIGGVVGYYSGNDNGYWVDREGAAVLGAITGVATGAFVGLLVGSFERWRETDVPASLSIVPMSDGSLAIVSRIDF